MKLSKAKIREFFEIGFTILPHLFSAEEMEALKPSFDRLYERALRLGRTQYYKGARFVVEGDRVDRIVWCGALEDSLLKIGEDPRLTVPASQLLGSSEMDQLINQAHYKMPGDQVAFQWHQDSENRYYGTQKWSDLNGNGSYVQTTLAVDAMTKENGPLLFAPGTQKNGHLSLNEGRDPGQYFDERKVVPVILEPGSVAIFGPYTIHGSLPNESMHSRRVLINGYAYPGANAHEYPGAGKGKRLRVE